MYHLHLSYEDCRNMILIDRKWFLRRLNKQLKDEDEQHKNTARKH